MAAFVGAALGFLVYNVRPATIFMGDGGSLFLGSFLASAALLAAPELKAGLVPVAAIPLFILLIPIFDTAFVSVTRRLAGRSPLHGGRDHLSHRLVALGIDERRAVLALYMLAALGGLIALSLQHADFGYAAILIALYIILLAGIGIVLGHVEAHATPEGADSTAPPPLVSEVAYQNRWYEVLLDLALISLAYYAAFRFRFQGEAFAHFLTYFAASFPLVLACQMAGLAIAGKYRQVWRSFGARELMGIIKGVWIGVASSALVILYLPYRFEGFSRLVFAIDAVVLASLLVGARVAITSADEYLRRRRGVGRPVLIYGAGAGGAPPGPDAARRSHPRAGTGRLHRRRRNEAPPPPRRRPRARHVRRLANTPRQARHRRSHRQHQGARPAAARRSRGTLPGAGRDHPLDAVRPRRDRPRSDRPPCSEPLTARHCPAACSRT